MRTRKMFNLLMLVALALGLIAAPVAAEPEAPQTVSEVEMFVEPGNAQAGAHYVFIFRLGTTWQFPGEAYIKFPEAMYDPNGDDDYTDSLIPDLTYPALDPRLDEMLISWGPNHDALIDPLDLNAVPVTPTLTTHSARPAQSWAWRGVSQVAEGEVWMALPADTMPNNPAFLDYVRIDFWGPANINPNEDDAGLVNPEEGTYTWCVGTDEENDLVCIDYDIGPPLPVRLWRKYQVPLNNCGYTRFEYVRGYETIEQAAYGVAEIWDNQGDYIDEPSWNLFDGCPDLSDLCNPADGTDVDCTFVTGAMDTGVAVGAVIEVEPGYYTNTNTTDLWSTHMRNDGPLDGGLFMDTPGVILGSTDGPDVTHIVGYAASWDVVDIAAGGITVGESQFNKQGAGPDMLFGFDVLGGEDGVTAKVNGLTDECYAAEVYSSTVEAHDVLTAAVVTGNQITFDCDSTENQVLCDALDAASRWPVKLVNLSNGWSAHVATTNDWDGSIATLDITAAGRFTNSEYIAIFYASADYDCVDARVDIRGNHIHDNASDGISVYSSAIWVDSNNVYSNTMNGFYGEDLKSCGSLMVCDGMNRNEQMLELSNNDFYWNNTAGDWDCAAAGEFDPNGSGDDAGIYIDSTGWIADGCDGCIIGSTDDNLYIHDNNVYENTNAGVWLAEYAADAGIRILWNNITDNAFFGLSNEADCSVRVAGEWEHPTGLPEVDVIFKYNNVLSNGNDDEGDVWGWGVKNWARDYVNGVLTVPEAGPMFNAKENYWNYCTDGGGGESPLQQSCPPGGPSVGPEPCTHQFNQQSAALGFGDAVDKGTFYNPWLAVNSFELKACGDMPDQCRYQDMRAYGSDSLELQAGWNTLAAPLPLESAYDDLQEISTLGGFLWDHEGDAPLWEVAYQYDNVLGQWDPIDGSEPDGIEAVHGYFIKINPELAPDGTKFPVIYGKTMMGLPAYDLTAEDGWNLVGSAFGIDREWMMSEFGDDQGRYAVAKCYEPVPLQPKLNGFDCDPEAYMYADDALVSIAPDMAGGGARLVTSPGVAGQLEGFWIEPWTVGGDLGQNLYTGQAYWVFMREPGTLAGYEIAPLFFEDPLPLW